MITNTIFNILVLLLLTILNQSCVSFKMYDAHDKMYRENTRILFTLEQELKQLKKDTQELMISIEVENYTQNSELVKLKKRLSKYGIGSIPRSV